MSESRRVVMLWIGITITIMHLSIISVVAFLAGVWLFFGIQEPWFLVYASVYLCLGIISMLITNYIKQK